MSDPHAAPPNFVGHWREWHQGHGCELDPGTLKRVDDFRDLKTAWQLLRASLVPFNERKQEFFCRVCRYRDPLGPDGNKLHDDDCLVLAMSNAMEKAEDR